MCLYVVFLQGVLTGCASGLSGQVRPFRRVYSGASAPPGPRRGARDAPPGCRCLPGTNLTAKRGLKAPFVAKFGVHLEKKSHVAREAVV